MDNQKTVLGKPVKYWLSIEDFIGRAILIARGAHLEGTRKGSGKPYITHPINVMDLVSECTQTPDVLAAAVLHDVAEDTSVTIEDIRDIFSDRVAGIVKQVSEPDKSDTWKNRKTCAISSVGHMENDAALVVAADKIDNLKEALHQLKTRNEGEFWGNFNAPKDQQTWYHHGIADALLKRDPKHPLFIQVKELATQVFGEVTEGNSGVLHTVGQRDVPGKAAVQTRAK
ncbi:MAG: HD domain-containing protein [Alphaproteobacteria bacterium]|nr:HD domain-containing protein [Alphaproteobacteria bacterium]